MSGHIGSGYELRRIKRGNAWRSSDIADSEHLVSARGSIDKTADDAAYQLKCPRFDTPSMGWPDEAQSFALWR
jgi:hypothetical protein